MKQNSEIEEVVAKLLIEKKLTIACAESCTGGLLCGKLVNFSGISDTFMQGCITYSNQAKIQRLNVSEETLEKYGAVSAQTAIEMARGIALSSNTDIGISTTGIAGPTGETKDKPIGLVYVGIYIKGALTYKELKLVGDRQDIRNLTVFLALDFLKEELEKLQ